MGQRYLGELRKAGVDPLKPPLQADTVLLWIGPGIILAIAGTVFVAYARRRGSFPETAAAPLSEGERQQLAALAGDSLT